MVMGDGVGGVCGRVCAHRCLSTTTQRESGREMHIRQSVGFRFIHRESEVEAE